MYSPVSPDDQKVIFVSQGWNAPGAIVAGGKDVYYATLDNWKSALKQQAADFTAQQQASTAATSSAATAAISGATPALTTASAVTITATPANPAKVTMPAADSAAATNASIALQILLKAQDTTDKSAEAFHTVTAAPSRVSSYAAKQSTGTFDASTAVAGTSSTQLNQTA